MTDIVHVAIPKTTKSYFDYLPGDFSPTRGQRVEVPFGKNTRIGIVCALNQATDCPLDKLKPITKVLDDAILIHDEIFNLCLWAADYYHSPLSDVLFTALPKRLREGKPAQLKKLPLSHPNPQPPLPLNPEQQTVFSHVINQSGFKTHLLHGITGSGKTEVYLQLTAKTLSQNKSILILVPEIGLTPQLLQRFQARFNMPISLLHSALNDTERQDAWLAAATGKASIVIGTRSAVFTPMPNLGLIIIDEEHDSSFKQLEGMRYSARDLSLVRAQQANIPIVLGSATPNLESLHNVSLGKFIYHQLTQRAATDTSVTYKLIDLRNQSQSEGLTETLIQRMREHLDQNNQVLLFLNRRGFAPVLLCHQCAWIADCKQCDAHLTLHFKPNYLQCHHCGHQESIIQSCPNCQSTALIPLGLGTQRLEACLNNLFPDKIILRIDRDSTRTKSAFDKLLAQIHAGKADILIGTQMLAKGHHFPNVTLVGILDADTGFFSPDFRATERLGQLLTQVSGRAGRAEKPGEVAIQTHVPDHPLLSQLLKSGYKTFAERLLTERKQAHFPPYSHLVLIRAEGKDQQKTREYLQHTRELLINHKIDILGPIPCPMEKRGGVYRYQLLLRASHRAPLQATLKTHRKNLAQNKPRAIKLIVDVDPQDIF